MAYDEPNPYWEQTKHVLGASCLFFIVLGTALAIERTKVMLVSLGWIKQNGLHYWALEIAEHVLFILDISALVIVVFVTTIRFVVGLVRP